jgi:hypothetical protein
MASETLAVPEEHLEAVIRVIRAGCREPRIAPLEVKRQLRKWCSEMEEYLERCGR